MINQTKKKSLLNITFSCFTVGLLISCSSNKNSDTEYNNNPIVTVNEKTLYQSDIQSTLSEGLSVNDSIIAADKYIKMWINDELIYVKAKENVMDQDRINELVENYRQSLTVFTYLEQLLKEELSGKISESELKNYYEQNSDKFNLESCLVKGLFLKIPRSSNEVKNLRKWYQSNSSDAKEKIEKASIQNTVIYDYFYDRWVNFDDIVPNIPTIINNVDKFVKETKNFETQDSLYVYLLHIEEYAITGTPAPYEFVKPQIIDILINQNRESFLKEVEADLYKKAIENKEIKFHKEEYKKN